MTVESVTYPRDLNVLYPEDSSPRSQIDDHIRNCKTALKTNAWELVGDVLVSSTIDTYSTHPFVANYDYQLVIDDAYFSDVSTAVHLRATTGGGTAYSTAAGYTYAGYGLRTGGSIAHNSASATSIACAAGTPDPGNAITESFRCVIECLKPAGTGAGRSIMIDVAYMADGASDFAWVKTGAQFNPTTAMDGISFYATVGTVTAANAKLYRRYSP